jgi:hypothetical protein
MAAISITAANFLPSANAVWSAPIALGATVTIGQTVYLDSATNTLKLAGAASTAAVAACVGLVEAAGAAGQLRRYLIRDPALGLGATILAGDDVWLHTTAGSITKTIGDLTSGNYKFHFGTMTSTTVLDYRMSGPGLVA